MSVSRFVLPAITVGLVVGSLSAVAPGAILYDAGLGTLPGAQGWVYGTSPIFGASATQGVAGGLLTLDSTPDAGTSDRAGYFSNLPPFAPHPGVPALDRAAGFTIGFDLRIAAESHAERDDNNDGLLDRAGFSAIVVTHDLKAIELGFWADRVWAYDDDAGGAAELFTQAEGQAFDTTLSVRRYELTILGNGYSLVANGAPVLSGLLRSYSAFAGTPDVYEIPNSLFFGDDTSSAEARAEIGLIEYFTIPAPGTLAWFMPWAAVGLAHPRRGAR